MEVSMIVIRNVLVATDFSDSAQTAMNYGRALARAYHATLHVMHVD
jgi:nucleotide-binding universal stress UspA family protein